MSCAGARPDDQRAGPLIGHRARGPARAAFRAFIATSRVHFREWGPGPAAGGCSAGGRSLSTGLATRRSPAFGPGVDVTFPNDPYLVPFMAMEQPGAAVRPQNAHPRHSRALKNARLIATPEERSLALQRIANGAIASNQLTLAHQTLEEAMTATARGDRSPWCATSG